jgi:hypothetical protein
MFCTLKLTGAAALATLVVFVSSASAQVTATLVTKSGQRHTGHNLGYRIDEREVAVRTSQHEEPRVPIDQVAYVDFGGTADTNPNLSGSQQAVVLRNGSVVKGQVLEIGHTNRADEKSPYLISFKTESGDERRFDVNEVGRVYFSASGSSTAATTAATTGSPDSQSITVSSQQQWTPTGITVRRGEMVTLNTTGEVRIGGPGNPTASAAGIATSAPGSPLEGKAAGALIGRVGNGRAFLIGNQTRVRAPDSGQLFLGINDGHLADNEGSFQVQVGREGAVTRRR